MRTTLNIEDSLIDKASKMTGIKEKTTLVKLGLEALGRQCEGWIALCRDVTVSADAACKANASVNAGSFDPNKNPITLIMTPSGPYGLGATVVMLSVQNSLGAQSTCSGTVTVEDKKPPTIQSVTASPNVLWPPNHKMIPVRIGVSVSDNCDAKPKCKITSVASNEPVNGLGDGDTAPDWLITGNLTVNLRSERSGKGSGRIYTITTTCTDASNNSSTKTASVRVPHNM